MRMDGRMPTVSPGYSITIRVAAPTAVNTTGLLAAAVAEEGGSLTALDVVESRADHIVVDVTCNTSDEEHAQAITDRLGTLEGVEVRKVSDRTFLVHLGGKLEIKAKFPIRNRDDLSRAYTPGVARVCLAIAENPDDARRLTIKRNTVAVVTDGSAVLGLGNLGPAAAMPVMIIHAAARPSSLEEEIIATPRRVPQSTAPARVTIPFPPSFPSWSKSRDVPA